MLLFYKLLNNSDKYCEVLLVCFISTLIGTAIAFNTIKVKAPFAYALRVNAGYITPEIQEWRISQVIII